jgi:hypothetical protein
VRIYLEKANGPQEQLCPRTDDSRLDASVNITGYSHQFHSHSTWFGFGQYNDDPGYPAVFACECTPIDESSLLHFDQATLVFNKTLPGPGTYPISDGAEGFGAVVMYTTPSIRDEDSNIPTVFWSQSGSVTLTLFSTAPGAPIEGTFTCNVESSQAIIVDGEIDYVDLTGTIAGSFHGVLQDAGMPGLVVSRMGQITLK